jgi:hypothetical protein
MGGIEVMLSIVADAIDCVNAAEEAVMLQSTRAAAVKEFASTFTEVQPDYVLLSRGVLVGYRHTRKSTTRNSQILETDRLCRLFPCFDLQRA